MRTLLSIVLCFAAGFLVVAVTAHAQDDSFFSFFKENSRRLDQMRGGAQVIEVPQQPRRVVRPRASPLATPPPPPRPDTPPPAPPSLFVDVIGDSLADLVAGGLEQQLADRPDISVTAHTKASSGLVRDDYYDWRKAVADLLAAPEPISAAVVMIGANDRQPLKTPEGMAELRSDAWRQAYVQRIDDILARFKARKIPVLWIGLPPMKSERLTADMVWFNEIFRERVEAAGGTYVDIWDGFVDADGDYTASGPDLSGQVTKLRLADGVHFSKEGAQVAAHYVERELRRILGDAKPAPAMAALPEAPPAPGVGMPPEGPGAAATDEADKPEFGPVQPLDPVASAGGASLLGNGVAQPSLADPSAATVLQRGDPLPAKEGRADDFRWPRPAIEQSVVAAGHGPEPVAATP